MAERKRPAVPAAYKLTAQLENGRSIRFCVPADMLSMRRPSKGRLAVNGMSYHDRAGENATAL